MPHPSEDQVTYQHGKPVFPYLTIADGSYRLMRGNAAGALLTGDFLIEVQKGNVAGHSIVNKFGRNPDIDTASGFEAIWNGGASYTGFAAGAEISEVFSGDVADAGTVLASGEATSGTVLSLVDDAGDFVNDGVAVGDLIINDTKVDHGIITAVTATSISVMDVRDGTTFEAGDSYRLVTAASTGLAAVRLTLCLDGNYASAEEYVVLNGLTAVDTVGQIMRCSRAFGVLVGSGGSNVGTITVRQKVTTANVFIQLPIGYNQTTIVAYTVPAGKRGYMLKWFASLAKKQAAFCNVRLFYQHFGEPLRVLEEHTIASTGTSQVDREWLGPKNHVRPRTDILVMADSSVDNMAVTAGFDILLVDDD